MFEIGGGEVHKGDTYHLNLNFTTVYPPHAKVTSLRDIGQPLRPQNRVKLRETTKFSRNHFTIFNLILPQAKMWSVVIRFPASAINWLRQEKLSF